MLFLKKEWAGDMCWGIFWNRLRGFLERELQTEGGAESLGRKRAGEERKKGSYRWVGNNEKRGWKNDGKKGWEIVENIRRNLLRAILSWALDGEEGDRLGGSRVLERES